MPRYVFEWLRDSRDGEWTVAHTGMLVVMLQQFENRTHGGPLAALLEVVVAPSPLMSDDAIA